MRHSHASTRPHEDKGGKSQTCNQHDMTLKRLVQDTAAFVAAWKGCSSSTAVRHLDVEAPQLFQVTDMHHSHGSICNIANVQLVVTRACTSCSVVRHLHIHG